MSPSAHTPITGNTWMLYELFGWDPRELFDQMFNCMDFVSTKVYEGIKQFLERTNVVTNGRHAVEFENGCLEIQAYIKRNVDHVFELLEVYMNRNVLFVPEDLRKGGWIRTAAQEGVDFTRPKEALELLEEVKAAEWRLQEREDRLAERKAYLARVKAERDYVLGLLARMPKFDKQTENLLNELQKPVDVPVRKRARTQRDITTDEILG